MKSRSRATPIVSALLLAAAALGGCSAGGMSIHNTSDHDISFKQSVEGGERSYTLHPGATLDMAAGSRLKMGDYVVEAR